MTNKDNTKTTKKQATTSKAKTTKNATTKATTKKQATNVEAKQENKKNALANRCENILKSVTLKNNIVLENVDNAKNQEDSEMIENKKAFALCVASKDNKIATRIVEVYVKQNNTCEIVAKRTTKEFFSTNYKANYKDNKKHLALYTLSDEDTTKALNTLIANC